MKLSDFIHDNICGILIFTATSFLLDAFLLMLGNQPSVVIIVTVFLISASMADFFYRFRVKRKFYNETRARLEALEKRYLIAEVMPQPETNEQALIRELLRSSNQSVIREINAVEDNRKEYKEYIGSWIHEVKTPATAIRLICENNRSPATDSIQAELSEIEMQVENVLYLARSEDVSRDYLIHRTDLERVVREAVASEKRRFIAVGMQLEIEPSVEGVIVSTDEKWVCFLLKQFFTNSIKYRNGNEPKITVYAKKNDSSLSLFVKDNGVGISAEDLPRVFDRGYTGSNGRVEKISTGMGLYLCKTLCDKLGVGISCSSEKGSYTEMKLVFPDSSHNEA